MIWVAPPARDRMASVVPTATIFPPAIATACATASFALTVSTVPLTYLLARELFPDRPEIALGASAEVDAPLPLTAEVQQMFRQLRAAGHGDEDDSALLRVAW